MLQFVPKPLANEGRALLFSDDPNNRVGQRREPPHPDPEVLRGIDGVHHRRNGVPGSHPHRKAPEIMSRTVHHLPLDSPQERKGHAREGGRAVRRRHLRQTQGGVAQVQAQGGRDRRGLQHFRAWDQRAG